MNRGTEIFDALNQALSDGHVSQELRDALTLALNPPLPPGLEAARQRCALVRRFDRDLYTELVAGLTDPPTFENFIAQPGVELISAPGGLYRLTDSSRAKFLAQPADIQQHARLANWLEINRPRELRERLYHLASAHNPQAQQLFEDQFRLAEERFDLAACWDLLAILNEIRSLAPELKDSQQVRLRRYEARSMFADAYYRSATYLKRDALLAKFEETIASTRKWIFHIYATGGMGKTMFLRSLLSRELISRDILLQRVDFDDLDLAVVKEAPWFVLLLVVKQLDRQLEGSPFGKILNTYSQYAARLQRLELGESRSPLNMADVASDETKFIASLLTTAKSINKKAVVFLDTLEEVTLAGGVLNVLLAHFQALKKAVPGFYLVLSGRYDILKRSKELHDQFADVTNRYAIKRFDDEEVTAYLVERRNLTRPGLVEAILQRLREPPDPSESSDAADRDDDSGIDDWSTPEDSAKARSNPFKLNLLAEIVLGRESITAQEILALPRVDLAYLLERVILRIPDQGVRWMIRYGSVPRRFTFEFAAKVLQPWLLKALHGELPEDTGDKHWMPDAGAVVDMSRLWDKLEQYASREGWLQREDNPPAARFHPDVVNPMRGLLSQQKVFPLLEDAAREYFESLASAEEAAKGPEQARALDWAEATAQAVFHAFQKEGVAAAPYWRTKLTHTFARRYPAARLRVLSEILASEYCLDQMEPMKWPDRSEPLVNRQLLAEAHAAIARHCLTYGGSEPSANFERLKQIEKAASRALLSPQCRFWLKAIMEAASLESSDLVQAAEGYRFALQGAENPDEEVSLHLRLGDCLKRLHSREAAEHYREAIRIQPTLIAPFVSIFQLRLLLADSYDEARQYSAARRNLEAALHAAVTNDQRTEALSRLVKLDVLNQMTATIEPNLSALRQIVGKDPIVDIFSAALCLERDQHDAAEQLVQPLTSESSAPLFRGQSNLTLGDIETEKLQLSTALELYEKAVAALQQAGQQELVDLAILRQVQLFERWAGNFRLSLSRVHSVRTLRSYRNVTFRVPADISAIHALWRLNRVGEAKVLLKRLLDEEGARLSSALRLSVMMAGLTFELIDPTEENLQQICELLQDVDPPAIRVRYCDTLFFRTQPIDVSPFWQERILSAIPLPNQHEATFTRIGLKVADTLRAFGALERAEVLDLKILQAALDAASFSRVRSALARLRKMNGAVDAIPAAVKERIIASFATGATPVMRAILTAEMGQEWSLPYEEAKKILDGQRVQTAWRARLEKRRGEEAERTGHLAEAAKRYQISALLWDELGDLRAHESMAKRAAALAAQPASPPPNRSAPPTAIPAPQSPPPPAPAPDPDPEIVLPRKDAALVHVEWLSGVTPRQGSASERAVDLLCDPPRAVSEIGRYLFGGRAISRTACLRFSPEAAAGLPWEWARNSRFTRSLVENRALYSESVRWMQASLTRLGEVLTIDGVYGPETNAVLLRAIGCTEGETREARAGLRAKIISRLNGTPKVLEIRRHKSDVALASNSVYEGSSQDATSVFGMHNIPVMWMSDFDPASLITTIQRFRPSVVHIVSSIEEDSEGWLQLRLDQDSPGLSIDLLERVFSELPTQQVRPFILLDIQALGGEADKARSLLLRNVFATKLLARYCTPGILAAGFGSLDEQAAVLNAVAEGMAQAKPIGAVLENMRATGSSFMAHQALALFTDDPDLPISLLPDVSPA